MLYLLQSIIFKSGDKQTPALFLGKNSKEENLLLVQEGNDLVTLAMTDGFLSMGWVKEPDKTSPTGEKIYHGSLVRWQLADGFKFPAKVPDKEQVLKEFKEIKKRIPQ